MDMRDDELVSIEFREPTRGCYVIPATTVVETPPYLDCSDLMARLVVAQNAIKAPIDIMTVAILCDTREELERHVVRYEVQVAGDIFEDGLKPIVRKFRERNRSRARRAVKKLAA